MASLSLTTFTVIAFTLSSNNAAPRNEGRIIGGLLAPEHSFPYLVGLGITKMVEGDRNFWCGGSLISRNLVLTAAHCVHKNVIDIKVKLGVHSRNSKGNFVDIKPHHITFHEKFNPNTTENDIALIHLPINVTLTDDIQLIQLAPSFMDQDFLQGQDVTAAGWGKVGDNVTGISEQLRFVDVTVISQTKCLDTYDILTPKNICVDGSKLKGTCKGDSGGPLVYEAPDDTRYLVGLTSFGSEHGCQKGFPAVFTRVTSFLDWISKHRETVVS